MTIQAGCKMMSHGVYRHGNQLEVMNMSIRQPGLACSLLRQLPGKLATNKAGLSKKRRLQLTAEIADVAASLIEPQAGQRQQHMALDRLKTIADILDNIKRIK